LGCVFGAAVDGDHRKLLAGHSASWNFQAMQAIDSQGIRPDRTAKKGAS
jgi:hypothetical protein